MTTKQTVQHLNELLNSRNATIEELRDQVSQLESTLRFGVDWMYQARGYLAAGLPVPRLEMTACESDGYSQELEVVLVNPNRDGTVTRVPLSYSKGSGGPLNVAMLPKEGIVPVEMHRHFPNGMFSDLIYQQKRLGLPAYVVFSPERRYVVEPGTDKPWPVRITAVQSNPAPQSEQGA